MEYKIIKKEAFDVIGKKTKISTKDGEHSRRIAEFWDECNNDGTCDKILTISDGKNMFGITLDFDGNTEQITYMIGMENTSNSADNGFDIIKIPAATWAVFKSIGPIPESIANTWASIFQEWFPETGFLHDDAPEIEVYNAGNTRALDYECEAWVPIINL